MDKKDLEGFKPLPTDLRGWNGNHDIFKRLIEQVKPKSIIEIGSWKGQSTITMAKACKDLGLKTKIQCIDTWLGAEEFYTNPTPERDLMKKHGYPQVYFQFLSNIVNEGVEEMIKVIPLPSNIGASIAQSAELIYIDGSHSEVDVLQDLKNMWDKLENGGIMFGDDYTNGAFPGVQRAVNEFCNQVGVGFEVDSNWFWIIKKQ